MKLARRNTGRVSIRAVALPPTIAHNHKRLYHRKTEGGIQYSQDLRFRFKCAVTLAGDPLQRALWQGQDDAIVLPVDVGRRRLKVGIKNELEPGSLLLQRRHPGI